MMSSSAQLSSILPTRCFLKPSSHGILKVNTDLAFTNNRIGIGILVRNHLAHPTYARRPPVWVAFFCRLLWIIYIEGYVNESSFSHLLIVESDFSWPLTASPILGRIFPSLELYPHIFLIIFVLYNCFSHIDLKIARPTFCKSYFLLFDVPLE